VADTRVEDLDEGTTGLELLGLDNGNVPDLEARGVVRDSGALGLGDLLGADGNHCDRLIGWVGLGSWLAVVRVEMWELLMGIKDS
jgi:hypothetical protein